MSVFVQIAERGNLTAAAEAIGKSLPSVVRILAKLEDTLQARLLNRTTRRLSLTEEGRIYLENCRRILAEIDDAEATVGQQQTTPSGLINVTAPVRFGELHVAPAINAYLQRYPSVRIRLLLLDRTIDMLEEGIDVAIRIGPMPDSSLIARLVGQIRQVVCASPDLLERHGRPERPELLSELPCVRFTGLSTASVWRFDDGRKPLAVSVDGPLTCNQVNASVQACIDGLGFGRFLCYQVMPAVRSGELKIALCRCGGSSNKPFCDGTHGTNGFTDEKQTDGKLDKRDNYVGQSITIHDNRSICSHAGYCTDKLKSVFRLGEEPWIDPDGATAQEIIDTIKQCPSGALSYTVDDIEYRDQDRPPMVTVAKDGPYVVIGGIELVEQAMGEGASPEHYALCRCGGSKNKPFCDGTHWHIGFRDEKT